MPPNAVRHFLSLSPEFEMNLDNNFESDTDEEAELELENPETNLHELMHPELGDHLIQQHVEFSVSNAATSLNVELQKLRTLKPPPVKEDFAKNFEIVSSTHSRRSYPLLPDTPLLYSNKVMGFHTKHSLEKVTDMMCTTAHLRDQCFQHGWLLEACVLGVYVVQHRVLRIGGGEHNSRRRINAITSFPKDLSVSPGAWNVFKSELMIFPGVHKRIDALFVTLSDLQKGMSYIRRLDGPYTSTAVYRYSQASSLRAEHRIFTTMDIHDIEEITTDFNPIFTKLHFFADTPKIRLTLEMLQSAFLVFHQLFLCSFSSKRYGAALAFVQQMERTVNTMNFMLNMHTSLFKQYFYVITKLSVAQCYFVLTKQWALLKVKAEYNVLRQKLLGFSRDFYPPCSIISIMSYPSDAYECVKRSSLAYSNISLPNSWRQLQLEKQFITTRYILNLMNNWTKQVRKDERIHLTARKSSLQSIVIYINELMPASNEQLKYRTLLYGLAAKCSKLLSEWDDIDAMMIDTSSINVVFLTLPPSVFLYDRSVYQHSTLRLMNLQYTESQEKKELRGPLMRTARHTIFDEVIYSIAQSESMHPTRQVTHLLSLMPEAVDLWFRPGGPIDPVTGGILRHELPFFNQIIAMFFHGLAMIYFQMDRWDESPSQLDNAKFLHALSSVFLKRPTVLYCIARAFLDRTIMTLRCAIKKYRNVFGRLSCIFSILRKLLYLLPVLYEACILCEFDGGPAESNSVSLSDVDLIFSTISIPGQTLRMISTYARLVEYLKEDLRIRTGHPVPVLRGSNNFREIRNFVPEILSSNNKSQSVGYMCRKLYVEPHPSLRGYRCGPHEKESTNEEPKNDFLLNESIIDLYDEMFSNFESKQLERHGCFDTVLVEMVIELKQLLDNAIIELNTLIAAGATHLFIKNEMPRRTTTVPQPHKSGLLLSEMQLLRKKLDDNRPPLLLVTRALYKLDSLLIRGHFAKYLLRGKLDA